MQHAYTVPLKANISI